MITTTTVIKKGVPLIRINYPDKSKAAYGTANTEGQISRLIYFHTRNYIVSKLKSFLVQRSTAFQMHKENHLYAQKINATTRLYDQVMALKETTLENVIRMVSREADQFEFIAPKSTTSALTKGYQEKIKPIIIWCIEKGAGL